MNRHNIFASLAVLGLLLVLGGLIQGARVLALGFYQSAGPASPGDIVVNTDASNHSDGIFDLEGNDRFYHFSGPVFSPTIGQDTFGGSDTVTVIYRTDRVSHSFNLGYGTSFTKTPDIYEAVQIAINGTVYTTAEYTQAFFRILGALGLGVILLAIGFPLWWASRRTPAAPSAPPLPGTDPAHPADPLAVAAAQARAESEAKLAKQLRGDALIRAGWVLILVGGGIYIAFLFFVIPDFGGTLSSVFLAAPLPGIVALALGYRLRKQSFT